MSSSSSNSRRPPPLRSRVPLKPRTEYIETDSGNRISRRSSVQGSQFIMLGGKTLIDHGVTLRGDLHRPDSKNASIAIGRYCVLEENVSIIPPGRKPSGTLSQTQVTKETGLVHIPVKIGSYVHIGTGTVSEAASIASNVYIGSNCQIGKFTVIKECVTIADNTVIPAYQVIAPFSRVEGTPAQVVEELPESAEQVLELHARKVYAGINVGGVPLD